MVDKQQTLIDLQNKSNKNDTEYDNAVAEKDQSGFRGIVGPIIMYSCVKVPLSIFTKPRRKNYWVQDVGL